jgi:hypothetical protein
VPIRVVSARAVSGALGVSMSVTSWEKYWGRLGFYSNAYDQQRPEVQVHGVSSSAPKAVIDSGPLGG